MAERSGVSVSHSKDRRLFKFGKRDGKNELPPYDWSCAGSNPAVPKLSSL